MKKSRTTMKVPVRTTGKGSQRLRGRDGAFDGAAFDGAAFG
jgi:hypothetical protein